MVYIDAYNMITPLGHSVSECFEAMLEAKTGIKQYAKNTLSDEPISTALFSANFFDNILDDSFSRLEKLGIEAIRKTIKSSHVPINSKDTVFILSSTKGNVELLEKAQEQQGLELWKSADKIAKYFDMKQQPMVVSNACVSGVAALVLAQRLIDMGTYKHAVVLGIDVISKFIVSGFQSFKALSSELCKPFDANRTGLNLGEGAGVIVLSSEHKDESGIVIAGGATSSDANHISGPSRTGEGLLIAIKKSLAAEEKVDFISAHGTATRYNDDMESKAIHRAGLSKVPVNSFKSYFGHTLGAAGLIESVLTIESMKQNKLVPTLAFSDLGTAEEINVIRQVESKNINSALKLTSGFGGTNAVILFKKYK